MKKFPPKNSRIIILGGGGHAAVLLDSMEASGVKPPCCILDQDCTKWGKNLSGVQVHGTDESIPDLVAQGFNYFVVGLGSVGNAGPRRVLFNKAVSFGLKPLTVIHPSAIISPWCEIGEGSQILPGAIVNARARIGINTIINSGAVIEHDCRIGKHVHVATGAKLASAVLIGDGAHIGAGAVLRQGVSIGEEAVIGMGAVVIRDVPPRSVFVGNPARHLRNSL